MSLIKDLRNFVLEEEFKVIFKNNKIDVINYTDIINFDTDKIIINYKGGRFIIGGKNLVVSKLLNDELLIEGKIEKLEFR